MRGLAVVFVAALAAASAPAAAPAAEPPRDAPAALAAATQLVVVTTPGWDDVAGELRRYTRSAPGAAWRAVGEPHPIVVGHGGLGWGTGFERAGPRKVEGDGRAPAGVFPLGTAFGFAARDSVAWLRLPYLPLTMKTECVDDVRSAHYNTVLERDAVAAVDWSSSEPMRRIAEYELGVVVEYNVAPRAPGRGSCIFLHIWERPGAPTVGCTAMDAGVLASLMGWLDPRSRPALVQLPRAAYDELRGEWGLPARRQVPARRM